MNFLRLTTATARAARESLPDWPDPPRAQLSPGALAAALDEAQRRWATLIDATTTAAHDHTASIADFADAVHRLDSQVAARLGGGAP
ncbi:hypothetical protein [uncultured Corynebacterium sp.]|uniref:hypothetical protein n=1 Tax=uncultured Corynebacterium sp. TaxID=159447 RepID=UPI0025959A06|nr:hypothetical protein [uncultured Corynebacterium sp.]